MKPVELIVLNFGMATDNKGGFYRTDKRTPVVGSDIRVIASAASVPLTYEEVYAGRKIVKELPDGIGANSLKIVNYSSTTKIYQALPSWLTERDEATEKK